MNTESNAPCGPAGRMATMLAACLWAATAGAGVTQKLIPSPTPHAVAGAGAVAREFPFAWRSPPPTGCPFPTSKVVTGVVFTGRYRVYTRADTWYPSWASDGAMYSPWTDGRARNRTQHVDHGPREDHRRRSA